MIIEAAVSHFKQFLAHSNVASENIVVLLYQSCRYLKITFLLVRMLLQIPLITVLTSENTILTRRNAIMTS